MKKVLLFPLLLGMSMPVSAQEVYKININKVCAAIVEIPYASDNFTDLEWQQFKDCLDFMKKFKD